MRIIGLTGSIACGKSTVSAILKEHGVKIIDADALSRLAVEKGQPGEAAILRAFGPGVFKEGQLDRKALGSMIFTDEGKRRELNALLHPIIGSLAAQEWEKYFLLYPDGTAAYDAALLIESGAYKDFEEIWLVVCDETVRLDRLMRRDGCSKEQAQARIGSQMGQERKKMYATHVIDNSYDIENTKRQVISLLERNAWRQ